MRNTQAKFQQRLGLIDRKPAWLRSGLLLRAVEYEQGVGTCPKLGCGQRGNLDAAVDAGVGTEWNEDPTVVKDGNYGPDAARGGTCRLQDYVI